MEIADRLKGNPAAFSYGWVLFILNLLTTSYVSALAILPASFAGQLIHLHDTSPSTAPYALSCFYYAFLIFQLPAGLLIDKYKSALFIPASLLISSLGFLLFSQSSGLITLAATRFLMGSGAAFAFLYAAKGIADWFPAKTFATRLALLIAAKVALTFGLSALFQFTSTSLGWRQASIRFGLFGLLFTLLSLPFIRRFKERYHFYFPEKKPQLKPLLRNLFDSSQMWLIGLTIGLSSGIFLIFLIKWALPIFFSSYQLQKVDPMFLILAATLGYALGTLFFAHLSNLIKRRKPLLPLSLFCAILLLIAIIYPHTLRSSLVPFIFFFLGWFVSAVNLGYVIIYEQNGRQIAATSIASVHVFYAFIIALANTVTTGFLSLEMTAKGATALPHFESVLSRIPIYFTIALLLSLFIRETRGKKSLT